MDAKEVELSKLERRRKELYDLRSSIIDKINDRKTELAKRWFPFDPKSPYIYQKLKAKVKARVAELIGVSPKEFPDSLVAVELCRGLLEPVWESDQRLQRLEREHKQVLKRIDEVEKAIAFHPENLARYQVQEKERERLDAIRRTFHERLYGIVERLREL